MASSVENVEVRVQAVQEQIFAWQATMLSETGMLALIKGDLRPEQVLAPLYARLKTLYTEDLPLAKLRDSSDLIIHAEGSATHGNAPQLRAVNWLGKTIKTQFTRLAAAALPVSDTLATTLARKAQWGITGLVPGSIYMGFALERPISSPGFEQADRSAFDLIVGAARSVSIVPQFVRTYDIDPELAEAITDPALRDAAMMAALELSPTQSSLFDSVEISAPGGDKGTLHRRERLVLRGALASPLMLRKQFGKFVGELNEIDLDSNRFQLRNVDKVGTLRCVKEFSRSEARELLGRSVQVEGIYEADVTGRPRLMNVEKIAIFEQSQASLI